MSSGGNGSRSSVCAATADAAKHRRFVFSALQSPAAVMLFRKYHEKGINICASAVLGNEELPLILYAAAQSNVDVIKVLHELLGAEAVNAPDKIHGQTPIIGAVVKGQSAAVHVLCELGADLNAQDNAGRTPVLFTAQKGFV